MEKDFCESEPTRLPTAAPRFVWLLLGTLTAFALHLFALTKRYSVNLFYLDQWDFLTPLFDQRGAWALFTRQNGPVREGLGLSLTQWIYDATQWNTRTEALTLVGLLVCGALLACWLKWRCFGRFTVSDFVLPILVLGSAQIESMIATPQAAHGVLPVLLVFLYCGAWLLRSVTLRYVTVVCLNFLLIFTGFGLFIGVLMPALLSLDLWQRRQRGETVALPLLALVVALGSWALFFVDYVFQPAVECFVFPHARFWEYPWFAGLSLARFMGIEFRGGKVGTLLTLNFRWREIQSVIATLIAWPLLLLFCLSFWQQVRTLVRRGLAQSSIALVNTILLGYSLLFIGNAALGRVCLGLWASQSSRYMTLLIPGFVGLYFSLLQWREPVRRERAVFAFVATLLVGTALSLETDYRTAEWHFAHKRAWQQCYQETGSIEHCDQTLQFKVYRWDRNYLQQRLEQLKAQQQSFYAHD